MSALRGRLHALEQSAWERRKRQILVVAFSDAARDRGWTPDQNDQQVQEALDEFNRMEPALLAICRRGGTRRDLAAYIADRSGVDVDELLTAAARLLREGVPDRADVSQSTRNFR